MQTSRLAPILLAALGLTGMSLAQAPTPPTEVTLDQAVEFALANNGTIKAAVLNTQATRQGLVQSQATFWPTLSAGYSVSYAHNEQLTGAASTTSGSTRTPSLTALWQPFDAGQKINSLRQSEIFVKLQEEGERDTRQSVELSVFSQYMEALRAEALLEVASLQRKEAEEIEKQTRAQVEAGDAPEKDIFQAQAEVANAKTNYFAALDRKRTARQLLISLMGVEMDESDLKLKDLDPWPFERELGLTKDQGAQQPVPPIHERSWWLRLQRELEPLEQVEAKAFALDVLNRPDVLSQSLKVQQATLKFERAKLDASLGFALSLSYTHAFGPDVLGKQGASLNVSVPLIDGSLGSKVKQAKHELDAAKALEGQTLRSASAEVTSAARTFRTASDRLVAAWLAVEAARKNYEAALAAQREGAEGTTVVTVLTALVSYTTAQVNFAQAKYDFLLSHQQFRRSKGADLDLTLWK